MTVSVFDHPFLGAHLGDAEVAGLWDARAQLDHMLAFERAFTRALAATGRITQTDADTALAAMADPALDLAALNAATARDGVVVPELIRMLRAGCDAPKAIHTGATSQDVTDTGLSLTFKALLPLLDARLEALIAALDRISDQYGDTRIMGRTRMQAALPITAHTRIDAWRAPLARHLDRLTQITPELCALQLGGPVGDRAALGTDAEAIAAHMADDLGLANLPCWHTTRDRIADFGAWMAGLSGSLGKIGSDIALMAQQGIAEVGLSGGGGSSAMPHKQNPIGAEALVTLAHFTKAQSGALTTALLHEQERSGVMWTLEWMVLPPMTVASAASLSRAISLLHGITHLGATPQPD